MPTFNVYRASDRKLVYQFEAETQQTWDSFPIPDYVYEAIAGADTTPTKPTVFNGKRDLSHLEFRSLFTQEEIEGIDEFQATFETQAIFDRPTKNRIRTAYITYSTAEFVNLDDPSTALGLGVYAAIGLIAPQRISEVLNG